MKIYIAIKSFIEDWLDYYGPSIAVLIVLALIAYFIYRFMYIRKINKILKKEEKPKKLLPIEYFTLITLISTILSLFVGIGVDNYIHRDIKVNFSKSIFDLDIRNIYEQLNEYSTKDKKIKVEPSYGFCISVNNQYEIIKKDGIDITKINIPRLNSYANYRCSKFESGFITFKYSIKNYKVNFNKWIEVEKYYEKIDIANNYIKKISIDSIENGKEYFYSSMRFYRTDLNDTFYDINIIDDGEIKKVDSYTYKGVYIIVHCPNGYYYIF